MNENVNPSFDVILPAGGRIKDAWAQNAGSETKTLLVFGGETILHRTIRVLRAMPNINRIVVIGPTELKLESADADVLLPEGETGPDNIFRGLSWLQENDANRVLDAQNPQDQSPKTQDQTRVLVMTTDLPFVTASAIGQFLDSCPDDADICIPIIEKNPFEARFPNATGFWVPLGGQNWTLGCAFLLRVDAMIRVRPHIERIFAARKSQMQMAKLLGPIFIARLFTKRLTIAHIQQRCEYVLRCRGAVIENAAPELAFDIDDEDAFRYATTHINQPRTK